MAGRSTVRSLLIVVVVLVVAIGAGVGLAVVLTRGSGDDGTATPRSTTTTGALGAGPTTTTSLDLTTTTAGAGATTTTAAGATSTTAAGSNPTTTTTARRGPCGTGSAVATFAGQNLQTTAQESSFTPTATVENRVNQPIEVDELVYDIRYPDTVRQVRFTTAGQVIQPGGTAVYTAERITTPRQYETTNLVQFAYFTEGRRSDCRVSLT